MYVVFLLDGIKNMDLLYTYTTENHPNWGMMNVENYHGDAYCQSIITDVFKNLSKTDWTTQEYIGSQMRIANESFIVKSSFDVEYNISFAINTYDRKAARIEVSIVAPETDNYDISLEKLKIEIKNRLLVDWNQCTWLADEQAAILCKTAYERTYAIENNLRAFASKVLIHFLGVDWIKRAGLEKEFDSVTILKEKFIQRVPDFDNINVDFLSMSLETLAGVIFNGVVYKENVVLNRQDYAHVQSQGAKAKTTATGIANFIKSKRVVDKHIWEDLFVPYIDDPSSFKEGAHSFIENRNHVAHSKILSWSAYSIIMQDFEKFDSLILLAIEKFDHDETADEVMLTWQAEIEAEEREREYYRDRLSNETGMNILDQIEISDWFDEILHEIFNFVYQRYHLDVCYEISDFSAKIQDDKVFTISCPAVEDGSARIDIMAEYTIDDELGADSFCHIVAQSGTEEELCKAEIRFHNGDGYEGEEGMMEASENTEYDTSELEAFRDSLVLAIESLNPYPDILGALAYENKGEPGVVAKFPCWQCGNPGVSIDESFLTVGRCCFCGCEHELEECARCEELFSSDDLENGLCPSCADYVSNQ